MSEGGRNLFLYQKWLLMIVCFTVIVVLYHPVTGIVFLMVETVIWPWSYGSCIYNYLCNQWLPLMLWVRIPLRARCTTLCDKVCQWNKTGRWFSPGPPFSSTKKTDDITEILLKVALNTIKQKQKLFNGSKAWISTHVRFCVNVATTIQINTKKCTLKFNQYFL